MAGRGTQQGGRRAADDALLLALSRGCTVAEAAAESGVSVRTAWRRLTEPEFRRRVEETRRALVQQAARRLADRMSQATDCLAVLMASNNDSIALGAAKAVLEFGLRTHETQALDERLTAIEEALADREKNR